MVPTLTHYSIAGQYGMQGPLFVASVCLRGKKDTRRYWKKGKRKCVRCERKRKNHAVRLRNSARISMVMALKKEWIGRYRTDYRVLATTCDETERQWVEAVSPVISKKRMPARIRLFDQRGMLSKAKREDATTVDAHSEMALVPNV
jgi:hypothetical protein